MSSKIKRRFLKTLKLLLFLYIGTLVLVFATHLPDRLIIHAAPGPLDTPGAQRMMLPTPNGQLEICIARPSPNKTPALYILYFVGNEDRVNLWAAGVARMWQEQTGRDTEAWGMNLPGFGLSDGPPNLNRIGPAALAAFDALHAHAGNTPIIVQAASLGTLAAFCIAANRPVAALTIQDPPPLADLVLYRNTWWNAGLLSVPIWLSLPANIDSIANARHATAPCIFITSERDTVIPPLFQQRIIDAYAGLKKKVLLPGAKHCSQPNPTCAAQLALDRVWLLHLQTP